MAAATPETVHAVQPAPPHADGTPDTATQDQVVTPWEVKGAEVDGKLAAIDYNKLVESFGTRLIDDALLERLEKLTGQKPHRFLRRGMFFSHRSVSWTLCCSSCAGILMCHHTGI